MTKAQFTEILNEECGKIICKKPEMIDEVFAPYIEDGTIIGLDWAEGSDHSVRILFKFLDDSIVTALIESSMEEQDEN